MSSKFLSPSSPIITVSQAETALEISDCDDNVLKDGMKYSRVPYEKLRFSANIGAYIGNTMQLLRTTHISALEALRDALYKCTTTTTTTDRESQVPDRTVLIAMALSDL